jgi:hypothetical protein
MKASKKIGYHVLWLLYYGVMFSIMVFTYVPMDGSTKISSVGVMLSIAAFVSPFFVSSRLINKFYYGKRKVKHAKVWGIIYIICTFLYIYGAYTRKLSTYDYSLIVLNVCIALSLFFYSEQKTTFQLEDIELQPSNYK